MLWYLLLVNGQCNHYGVDGMSIGCESLHVQASLQCTLTHSVSVTHGCAHTHTVYMYTHLGTRLLSYTFG